MKKADYDALCEKLNAERPGVRPMPQIPNFDEEFCDGVLKVHQVEIDAMLTSIAKLAGTPGNNIGAMLALIQHIGAQMLACLIVSGQSANDAARMVSFYCGGALGEVSVALLETMRRVEALGVKRS